MIKAIIFDVDGVLLDSVDFHFESWESVFKGENIPFDYDQYLTKVNGVPRKQGILNMIPDIQDEHVETLMQTKQSHFEDLLHSKDMHPLPEVKETLEKLQKQYRLGAASSSKNAKTLLQKTGLSDFFEVIITGNDFSKSKPDPELFLLAAEKMNIDPKTTAVVEDAAIGLKAAKAAGMLPIGLSSSHDASLEQETSYIVSTVRELPDLLENLELA